MIIKASKVQECDARPNGFIRAGKNDHQSPNAGFINKTKFIINTRLVVGENSSKGVHCIEENVINLNNYPDEAGYNNIPGAGCFK